MVRTGLANLPLHGGKAPAWLFNRMVKLAREIVIIIVSDYSPKEVLNKLSDPFWFQAFGCVLGFDWHSSGVTTTVCGAVKEGIKGIEKELGLFVAGGKGRVSRATPSEIEKWGNRVGFDPGDLVYASRMSAKVDSAALQDGYQIYQHTFFFTKDKEWAVVQQGMNDENRYARRYHWLGSDLEEFVVEPHSAICCDEKSKVLNMVAEESEEAREVSAFLSNEGPGFWEREINRIKTLSLPPRHEILKEDINSRYFHKIMTKTYEKNPKGFEELLNIEGVGPKTIRSLSLLSELIYSAKSSFEDPARFSFAHGGKDGHPYPVDREAYDKTIEILKRWVSKAKFGRSEKDKSLRRLEIFYN